MSNKYCNLNENGNDLIKNQYTRIPEGFRLVEQDVNYINNALSQITGSQLPAYYKTNILNYGNNLDDGVTDIYTAMINALDDVGNNGTLYFPNSGNSVYLLDTSLDMLSYPNVTFEFEPGAYLKISNISKTITGNNTSISAGLTKIFDIPTNWNLLGSWKIDFIYPEWFGAIGDTVSDDTQAVQSAINSCKNTGAKFLFYSLYGVTSKITTEIPLIGLNRLKTGLKYIGVGVYADAILEVGNNKLYYQEFRNFSVQGANKARYGMKMGYDNSYNLFVNCGFYDCVKYGFYYTNSWANAFIDCSAYGNGEVGFYLDTQNIPQAVGTSNGVIFSNVYASHNGLKTYSGVYDPLGTELAGIIIKGATALKIVGGRVEENGVHGIMLIGVPGVAAIRSVELDSIYGEYCPTDNDTGSWLYCSGVWSSVSVSNCNIDYGSKNMATATAYAFYFDGQGEDDASFFRQKNNTFSSNGLGSVKQVKYAGGTGFKHVYNFESKVKKTRPIGLKNTGSVTTVNLLEIDCAEYVISGFITIQRNSGQAGVFPFIASKSATITGVTVGASLVSVDTPNSPTMAWSSNILQVSIPAYYSGFVTYSTAYFDTLNKFEHFQVYGIWDEMKQSQG